MPLTGLGLGVQDHAVKALCPLLLLGAVAGLIVSCSDFNRPLSSDYDPLDSPGARRNVEVVDLGPTYTPGHMVETTTSNTAFYASLPRGTEQPQKALPAGTILKVISSEGTYVQVEIESGEVGYVPSIMIAEKPVAGQVPIVPLTLGDPLDGLAPEPEIQADSVEDAAGAPGIIDPSNVIE